MSTMRAILTVAITIQMITFHLSDANVHSSYLTSFGCTRSAFDLSQLNFHFNTRTRNVCSASSQTTGVSRENYNTTHFKYTIDYSRCESYANDSQNLIKQQINRYLRCLGAHVCSLLDEVAETSSHCQTDQGRGLGVLDVYVREVGTKLASFYSVVTKAHCKLHSFINHRCDYFAPNDNVTSMLQRILGWNRHTSCAVRGYLAHSYILENRPFEILPQENPGEIESQWLNWLKGYVGEIVTMINALN